MNTDAILFETDQEYGVGPDLYHNFYDDYLEENATEIKIIDEEMWEEEVIETTPIALLPDGWHIWLLCNSPGAIYIGTQDNYDWHDWNGYAPCKVSWDVAFGYLTKDDGLCGKWKLEVCDLLSEKCRNEMESKNGF